MKYETVTYQCDKCGGDLPGHRNSLDIVTPLSENSPHWSRLHVQIKLHSGVHNNGKMENADLCQGCALTVLKDAVTRVRAGERATKGTEDSTQKGWKEE